MRFQVSSAEEAQTPKVLISLAHRKSKLFSLTQPGRLTHFRITVLLSRKQIWLYARSVLCLASISSRLNLKVQSQGNTKPPENDSIKSTTLYTDKCNYNLGFPAPLHFLP